MKCECCSKIIESPLNWRDKLNKDLVGRTIKHARRSDSHGNVLILNLDEGIDLYCWSFQDSAQVVVYNNDIGKILSDLRSEPCKKLNEKYYPEEFKILHTND